jgi:hypothetical protein
MPDISMCSNKDCPLANRCYRSIAIPNPNWQSYAEFDQVYCEYFIDVRGNYSGTVLQEQDEIEPFRG